MISKQFLFLPICIILSIHFNSCGTNSKVLQENPPFVVKEASFQKWFAGAQEFGSGFNVFISLESLPESVQLERIYFRAMEASLLKKSSSLNFEANLKSESKKEVIMDENPVKESNNPLPNISSDFPFSLQPNEAVIAYRENNKTLYYKVTLTEKETQAYPTSNTQNNSN